MNRPIADLRPAAATLALYAAVVLTLVSSLRFLGHDALPYVADYSESTYARYWVHRGWLLVHIVGGAVALLAGPFQLWSGLRRRSLRIHRWTGYAYVIAIAFAATSSFYLTFHTRADFGTALFVLALMWWLTIVMAYLAIRNGRVDAHRDWMIRSYILTFSFVTYRVIVPMSAFDGLGPSKYATALWISWVAPYMVAEVFMHWERVTRRRSPASRKRNEGVEGPPSPVGLAPAGASERVGE